jgi:ssDNA thymidine ADP-ribosyltransferase, DarT
MTSINSKHFAALGAVLLGVGGLVVAQTFRKRRQQAREEANGSVVATAPEPTETPAESHTSELISARPVPPPSALQQCIEARGITSLYHFTRCQSLTSILEKGLLSHADVQRLGLPVVDQLRLDRRSDHVCLSVSFPNARMFYKYAASSQEGWCILDLKPELIHHHDCLFLPMNAARGDSQQLSRSDLAGSEAFERLFASSVNGQCRSSMLHDRYPTDVQAEVMVPSPIGIEWIRAVHFRSSVACGRHEEFLAEHGIEACATPRLFLQREHGIDDSPSNHIQPRRLSSTGLAFARGS